MLALSLLLLAHPAIAAGTTVVASKTFPAAKVERIEIHTESGDVKVKARPGSEIRVEAFKPEDSEGHCALKLHLEGGTLTLEARKPDGSHAVCDGGFSVAAPGEAAVEAYTGSGDVAITGMRRTLKLRTGSGAIRLTGVRGQAFAMTGSGAITAELPSAAFDARSGSGDIAVKLTQASGLVSLRTGSGNVQVTAPKNAKVRLTASTASGTVVNPFPPAKESPLVVEAFSGSGNITLIRAAK